MNPLPRIHSIVFLRKAELHLLRLITNRSEYGHNITAVSEYQDYGDSPAAMRNAAYVLQRMGFLTIVRRDNKVWMKLDYSFAREACQYLDGVDFGFTPAQRDIVALTTLIQRLGRQIDKDDAPGILCSRGDSLRFYMRKTKQMNYEMGSDRKYLYNATKRGQNVADCWLEFTRLVIRTTTPREAAQFEPKLSSRVKKATVVVPKNVHHADANIH